MNNNTSNALRVYLFVSRNKDNKGIKDFTERRRTFLAYDNMTNLDERFNEFVQEGVLGEMSRLYKSVNARDPEKLRKAIITELVNDDNIQIGKISTIAAGIAAKKANAAERKWLIDFDSEDDVMLHSITADIETYLVNTIKRDKKAKESDILSIPRMIHAMKSPNGYAIVVDRPFDPRDFVEKWGDIAEIKKDDLLIVDWERKREHYN